jgi:phage shock protein C
MNTTYEEVDNMDKQLCRSKRNKMLAGVCGGIAEYFSIDPTIIRIVWVVVSLTYGLGIVAYIIAAIIMPEKRNCTDAEAGQTGSEAGQNSCFDGEEDKKRYDPQKTNLILGAGLIVFGVMLFAKEAFGWVNWVNFKTLWPLGIILLGVVMILKMGNKEK